LYEKKTKDGPQLVDDTRRGRLLVWTELLDGTHIGDELRIDTTSVITITKGDGVEMKVKPWDGKFNKYVLVAQCLPDRNVKIALTLLTIEPKTLNRAPRPLPPIQPESESAAIRALGTCS
jgi:hypothetical protein